MNSVQPNAIRYMLPLALAAILIAAGYALRHTVSCFLLSFVIAYLLDRKADANARDQFGDTPLIVACAKGNAAAAGLLLERGADPALKDQEGRTAKERSAPGVPACRKPGPP